MLEQKLDPSFKLADKTEPSLSSLHAQSINHLVLMKKSPPKCE
jgi:hypothetical protein